MAVATQISKWYATELKYIYFRQSRKNGQLRTRILMLWMIHVTGSARAAASYCLTSHTTVMRWYHRYLAQGVAGLLDRSKSGRPELWNWKSKISYYFDYPPSHFGMKQGNWIPIILYKRIYQDTNIWFHISTLYKALKRHGWHLITPRLRHYKADKSAQDMFKAKIRQLRDEGHRLASMDQTFVNLKTDIRKVLARKGSKPTVSFQPKPSPRDRGSISVTVFGAIFADTCKVVIHFAETINTKTFMSFLKKIKTNYGKGRLYLTLDNHFAHTSKIARVRASKHGIHLVRQPAFSPELNPSEEIWRQLKEHLKLRIFDNIEEAKHCVLEFFEARNYQIKIDFDSYFD